MLFLLGLKHANAASSVDVRLEESLYNTRRRFEDLQTSIFAKEQRQKHQRGWGGRESRGHKLFLFYEGDGGGGGGWSIKRNGGLGDLQITCIMPQNLIL